MNRVFKVEIDKDGKEIGRPYVISVKSTNGSKHSFVSMTRDELTILCKEIVTMLGTNINSD